MVDIEQYINDMWLAGVRLQHAQKRIKKGNEYTNMLVMSLYTRLDAREVRLSHLIQQEPYVKFHSWPIYKGEK